MSVSVRAEWHTSRDACVCPDCFFHIHYSSTQTFVDRYQEVQGLLRQIRPDDADFFLQFSIQTNPVFPTCDKYTYLATLILMGWYNSSLFNDWSMILSRLWSYVQQNRKQVGWVAALLRLLYAKWGGRAPEFLWRSLMKSPSRDAEITQPRLCPHLHGYLFWNSLFFVFHRSVHTESN